MESSTTNTQDPFTYKYRVRDLAYAAGIIDGEGCITAAMNSGRGFVILKVTNTHYPLMEWFTRLFGGRVQPKNSSIPGWKESWDWYCSADNITPMLHLLIPYLRQKQPQAYLAMAVRSGIVEQKKKERIDNLILKLQRMNKRGR